MADGTLIIGLAGLFGATVVGPLIAHQIRKDEEGRSNTRDVIDGTISALVRCHSQLEAVVMVQDQAKAGQALEVGYTLLREAESWTWRLRLRLGSHALVEQSDHAYEALGRFGSAQFKLVHKESGASKSALKAADNSFSEELSKFGAMARRWHEDEYGQVPALGWARRG
jgi:hypothetical protein